MSADLIPAPLGIFLWIGVFAVLSIPTFINSKTNRAAQRIPLSLNLTIRIVAITAGFSSIYISYKFYDPHASWRIVWLVAVLAFASGQTMSLAEEYFSKKREAIDKEKN